MRQAHNFQLNRKLKLSELMSSLSYALDMTEGQPPGHCVRCCYIGMNIGEKYGLSPTQLWELFYVLLLKDLGCSSNAARICQLYLTDDLSFKHDFKEVEPSLPSVLNFVMSHTGLNADLAQRFKAVFNIMKNGSEISKELINTRCNRGAQIAQSLRFNDAVARGIYELDEHWNGKGQPQGLKGDEISIYSRIALMAQVIDVFTTSKNPENAIEEVKKRCDIWFDPQLCSVFDEVAKNGEFWEKLSSPDIEKYVYSLEPALEEIDIDDDFLDDIASAFGQIVDSKSPYTAGHSSRVAFYVDMIAKQMGFDLPSRRWLKRGALLHDIGKLGVSNALLDKDGKLTDEEWVLMRAHALYTEQILERIGAFSSLALIAGAHHERLDGTGYPHKLAGADIPIETRIISVADFFDALTADRPYRKAMSTAKAFEIMDQSVHNAIDEECLNALKAVVQEFGNGNEAQSQNIAA
ncbi:MAG: HD-GYP domain-containing protein [Caulobacterales bacterium]|nr:HD-GYP domain-containing protein [Caulobacterales bacterium]MCA0372419.1 HD-GYP domain-containing protein [Pseudomonadota bacterium]